MSGVSLLSRRFGERRVLAAALLAAAALAAAEALLDVSVELYAFGLMPLARRVFSPSSRGSYMLSSSLSLSLSLVSHNAAT